MNLQAIWCLCRSSWSGIERCDANRGQIAKFVTNDGQMTQIKINPIRFDLIRFDWQFGCPRANAEMCNQKVFASVNLIEIIMHYNDDSWPDVNFVRFHLQWRGYGSLSLCVCMLCIFIRMHHKRQSKEKQLQLSKLADGFALRGCEWTIRSNFELNSSNIVERLFNLFGNFTGMCCWNIDFRPFESFKHIRLKQGQKIIIKIRELMTLLTIFRSKMNSKWFRCEFQWNLQKD